jgi:hypothetical protein
MSILLIKPRRAQRPGRPQPHAIVMVIVSTNGSAVTDPRRNDWRYCAHQLAFIAVPTMSGRTGLSTRRTSRSARNGSGTVQSARVETTVSN